jgi:hypothetical protein
VANPLAPQTRSLARLPQQQHPPTFSSAYSSRPFVFFETADRTTVHTILKDSIAHTRANASFRFAAPHQLVAVEAISRFSVLVPAQHCTPRYPSLDIACSDTALLDTALLDIAIFDIALDIPLGIAFSLTQLSRPRRTSS